MDDVFAVIATVVFFVSFSIGFAIGTSGMKHHETQEQCELNLPRSEHCIQVWVRGE